jgi:hypothetical protein
MARPLASLAAAVVPPWPLRGSGRVPDLATTGRASA